jgi:hypothetical protein
LIDRSVILGINIQLSKVPVLNEVSGEVQNSISLNHKGHVMPGHSNLGISIDFWDLILPHIAEVFDTRVAIIYVCGLIKKFIQGNS